MTVFGDPPAWVADAVFYQIFPDRFSSSPRVAKPGPLEPWDSPPTTYGFKGGDLLGIVDRLDYLTDLGVNALYLTPIFSSASNHRYHTYDYYQVDPLLGGNDALRELLDESHARGMRVVLDGVFNHSGRGFWPFHHVVETGGKSPYVGWFHVDEQVLRNSRELRPYPSRDEERRMAEDARSTGQSWLSRRHLGYQAWWDLPALPKLNTDDPGMREHLMGAAEHWIRFGIDGWRLDVAEEIDAGFWREFRKRVRDLNPDAYIVAEVWKERPQWSHGDTFDALMNYPLTEALLSFSAGKRLDMGIVQNHHEYRDSVRPIAAPAFAERLTHLMANYRPEFVRSQLNLLDSHDTARFLTVSSGDVASLRLALLATMTLPGAPCVYYGDEIGVAGGQDPDSRRSFPWDEGRWDADLLTYTRALIAQRHARPVLRHGEFKVVGVGEGAVAYSLRSAQSVAVVVMNAGDARSHVRIADSKPGTDLEPVSLPGTPALKVVREDGALILEVDARSGGLLVSPGSMTPLRIVLILICFVAAAVAAFGLLFDTAGTRLPLVVSGLTVLGLCLGLLGFSLAGSAARLGRDGRGGWALIVAFVGGVLVLGAAGSLAVAIVLGILAASG